MYSGPLTLAHDLVAEYEKKLKRAKLRVENYRDVLWKPMEAFVDANEKRTFLQGSSDVSLLVVALVDHSFRVITIDSHGIAEHPYFGAIGTGQDSALALLRWRKPDRWTDVQAALYFAYEAKRLGEVSPHVGSQYTHMCVLWPDEGNILEKIVTSRDKSELEEAFKRFGPQPFDFGWRLSSAEKSNPPTPKADQ